VHILADAAFCQHTKQLRPLIRPSYWHQNFNFFYAAADNLSAVETDWLTEHFGEFQFL